MTCVVTPSLGVYVLGAAGAEERRAIEEHLPGCRACREELARLSPLPGLLSCVPVDEVPAGLSGAAIRGLRPEGAAGAVPEEGTSAPVRQRLGRARRWRVPGLVAAAAAIGVAIGFVAAPGGGDSAGAGPAGGAAAARPGGGGGAASVVMFTGSDQATHVQGTAALTSTSWGSTIDLWLHGRLLGTRCELVVRSRTGGREVAGSWNAWGAGWVVVPASTGWEPSQIASLQVQTSSGELVTMTSAGRGASSAPR